MKRCVLLLGVVIALVALETSAWSAEKIISGVPRINWYGGCSPTASGMILEYWDSHPSGYWSGLITTPSINDAIGSQGVYSYEYDYWTGFGLTNPGLNNDPASDPDPYLPGAPPPGDVLGWPPHPDNSIADFLGTSRSNDGLADGDTRRSNIAPGVMAYANNNQGYYAASWLANVERYDPPGGAAPLTWETYKAEIDQNRPVLISVRNFHELDPQKNSPIIYGHSVVGYGYRDAMFEVKYFEGPPPGGQVNESDPTQWTTAVVGGFAVMDTWAVGDSGSSWLDSNGTPMPPVIDGNGVEWWPFIDLTATNGWLYDNNTYAVQSWFVRGAVYFQPLAQH